MTGALGARRAEEEAARQAAIDAGDPEPEAAEAPEAVPAPGDIA